MKHLPVEDLTCHLPSRLESEMFNARLQLVIVSPLFLQWVYSHPAQLVGRLVQQLDTALDEGHFLRGDQQ